MDIPPEVLETFSLFYQGIKQFAVELVMECHDPNYQATLDNVRRRISKMEEETFQLNLFEYDGSRTQAGSTHA